MHDNRISIEWWPINKGQLLTSTGSQSIRIVLAGNQVNSLSLKAATIIENQKA